jgi:hypothetical protein
MMCQPGVTVRPKQVAESRIDECAGIIQTHPRTGGEMGLDFIERDDPRTWRTGAVFTAIGRETRRSLVPDGPQ